MGSFTIVLPYYDCFFQKLNAKIGKKCPSASLLDIVSPHTVTWSYHYSSLQKFINVMLCEIIESHGHSLLYQVILYTIMVLYICGSNSSAKNRKRFIILFGNRGFYEGHRPPPQQQHARAKIVGDSIVIKIRVVNGNTSLIMPYFILKRFLRKIF